MERLLIVNAQIVNGGEITSGDVLIESGRIEAIGVVPARPDQTVIDAQGRFLLPGMIDSQVSFREPDMTLVADMASESRAAVAGGVTSFLDLPATETGTATLELLEQKHQLAKGRCQANYGFYFGACRENLNQITGLDKGVGAQLACAVNVYMGGDVNDNRLVDDPDLLETIFSRSPLLLVAHCEDMPTILENEESYRSIYGDSVPVEFHPQIRSEEACVRSSELALQLAREHHTPLHLLHLSTAQEVAFLSDTALAEKRITAETCAHFLHFSDEDYATRGALIKCNPAIKTAEDRASLIQALLEGQLDMVSSGHAPHSLNLKQAQDYFQIPSGMPMAQHALLVMLEHYQDGIFSLEFIAEKTSHAVAKRFGIRERGFIREGYWADLVLVDVAEGGMSTHSNSLSRCGWTPFDGYKFRSSIVATIVNGQLVWSEGSLQNVQSPGMALEYVRADGTSQAD